MYEFVYFSHWSVTKHKPASLLPYDGLCSQEPPSNVSIKRMSTLSLALGGEGAGMIQILYLDISQTVLFSSTHFPHIQYYLPELGVDSCISDCPFCKIRKLGRLQRTNSNRSQLTSCFLPNKTTCLNQKRKRTKRVGRTACLSKLLEKNHSFQDILKHLQNLINQNENRRRKKIKSKIPDF